jgi:membrane-associated phospholipid phosphatase
MTTLLPHLHRLLTNIGDAAFTLPIALTCAAWLAMSHWRLALRWALTLAAGMSLVGATKILYAGWHVGIASIDFRVISGHTMLATAVWTVVFALLTRRWPYLERAGILGGLMVGAATGLARVHDHSHSVSEVISGWVVGAVVAAWFLHACARADIKPLRPVGAAFGLMLVSMLAYGHRAPFQYLIDVHTPVLRARVAAEVSGLL